MLTDDPGTPGDGNLETNIAATLASTGAERSWSLPELDINYGVGDRIQLNVETSLALSTPDASSSRWGAGATSLAMKWRFADQERAGASMSIYPRVERAIFASSSRRGLADVGTQVLLPMQLARDIGRFGVNVEVGSLLSSVERSKWVYGIVGGLSLNSATEAMAELHGESPSRFDRDWLVLNVGLRQRLATNLNWIASAGHAVRSRAEDSPTWLAYCGLQWLH